MAGSQDYLPDPRNDAVVVYLNGELVARKVGAVSQSHLRAFLDGQLRDTVV